LMPINLLIQNKDQNNVCFDGKVKINLKQNITIGYLKLKIQYGDIKDDKLFGSKSKSDSNYPIKLKEEDVRKKVFTCI